MSIKPDEEFDSVIKRPSGAGLRRPANRDGVEVSADEQQDFLTRCNALLAKGSTRCYVIHRV